MLMLLIFINLVVAFLVRFAAIKMSYVMFYVHSHVANDWFGKSIDDGVLSESVNVMGQHYFYNHCINIFICNCYFYLFLNIIEVNITYKISLKMLCLQ